MNKLESIIDYWEEKRIVFYDLKEGLYPEMQYPYDTVCLFLTHLKELRDES